jgi:toxin ParE1/3/4
VAETKKQWGEEQARKYRQLIETSIRTIATHPNVGREYGGVGSGVRGYHVKSPSRHIIFYRLVAKNTVEVGRFLHESMDIDRELKLYISVAQV